ncbi:Virulence protein SSD1 [Fusarium oxysporum f. sp. albedinis]|nr:Virulence protein SSD1 [Fusarium oxysporum f. sp. albedinis]
MAPAGVDFGGVSTNCSVVVVTLTGLLSTAGRALNQAGGGCQENRSSGTPLDAGEDAGTSRIRKPGTMRLAGGQTRTN